VFGGGRTVVGIEVGATPCWLGGVVLMTNAFFFLVLSLASLMVGAHLGLLIPSILTPRVLVASRLNACTTVRSSNSVLPCGLFFVKQDPEVRRRLQPSRYRNNMCSIIPTKAPPTSVFVFGKPRTEVLWIN